MPRQSIRNKGDTKMLVRQAQQPQVGTMFSGTSQLRSTDWRETAIAAYQAAERDDVVTLRAALTSRVLAFTGYLVPPTSIFVDRETRTATVALDGVVFRLRRGDLMLVRACASCATGELESTPLVTLPDLGHALANWEPRCGNCPEGDADDAASSL